MTRRAPGLALLLLPTLLALTGCTEQDEPRSRLDSEVVRSAEVDWSFARDVELASLQTARPPRSRAVWIVVHDGALYVATGIARRATWPAELREDPVVLVRILDRLFLRHATWVTDGTELATLREVVRDKYGAAPRSDDESSGFFRMDPAEDA